MCLRAWFIGLQSRASGINAFAAHLCLVETIRELGNLRKRRIRGGCVDSMKKAALIRGKRVGESSKLRYSSLVLVVAR